MAGEWARVRGSVLGLWPLGLGIFAAGFSFAVGIVCGLMLLGAILFSLSLAFIGYALVRGIRRVESFFVGARGEERVSSILKSLPETYHVFNDYVARGTHVDHVVVGPAGIFAVETKYWRGRVTVEDGHILVDGHLPSRHPLKQVTREAALVKSALADAPWTGVVTPVLAFASDTFCAGPAEIHGAVVLNSSDLAGCFATKRVAIQPDEVARLVSIMEANL